MRPRDRCRDVGDETGGTPAMTTTAPAVNPPFAADYDAPIPYIQRTRDYYQVLGINTYLPLAQLKTAAAAGRIGSLGPRLHGLPTNRSHRVTMETDVPELLRRCHEDGVGAAVLVPS